MGKPDDGNASSSVAEYIGGRGEPGELKHLSSPRKRKPPRLPEEWRAKRDQPDPGGCKWHTLSVGGCRALCPARAGLAAVTKSRVNRSEWNLAPQRAIVP